MGTVEEGDTFGGWSGTPSDAAAERHSAAVWMPCAHTPLVVSVYAGGDDACGDGGDGGGAGMQMH